MKDFEKICELVGDVKEEDLRYVDCAVAEHVGIFVPSIGFCQYAISPQHTHPAYMFNLFVEPEYCIIEQAIEVPPNHYLSVVLSPKIPHEEKTGDSFKRYYAIMIDREYFDREYKAYAHCDPPEYIWKQFLVGEEVMFYIKQFIKEYERADCNPSKVLEPLSMLITQEYIRSLVRPEEKALPISKVYEIERVEEYIQQNFSKKLSTVKLAEVANMSLSHFNRMFKKETGFSPMEYLRNTRIEKAKKFLKEDERTMTDIALTCGFSSASHFAFSFQKQVGQIPKDYRRKYGKQDYDRK